MNQQIVKIALLLLLLLTVIAPFSALSALMLIIVGLLLYNLIVTLVKAFATAEVGEAKKDS